MLKIIYQVNRFNLWITFSTVVLLKKKTLSRLCFIFRLKQSHENSWDVFLYKNISQGQSTPYQKLLINNCHLPTPIITKWFIPGSTILKIIKETGSCDHLIYLIVDRLKNTEIIQKWNAVLRYRRRWWLFSGQTDKILPRIFYFFFNLLVPENNLQL